MTRPQKGTAEHRAWVIATIVEAARRAGRSVDAMSRDRVTAQRTARDEHWPSNDDYSALGGYAAVRAMMRPTLDPPVLPDPVADLIERDREAERRDERARLLREIAELRAEVAHMRAVANDTPPPSVQPRERAYGLREAAMLACASDWHLEEFVDPAKIGHVNAYDLSIAEASARRFFDALVWLYDHHSTHFALRDLVLWLGGDLIGGYIHDELVETNQLAPLPATRFAREVIGAGIRMLLAETNLARILVPCSYGNHGRTTVKSRISSGAENSYENHLYHSLAADFRDEPRVEFVIASGPLLYVDVLGTTVRFTHGDAVKYGGGVGGISVPINKAIAGWDTTRRADLTVMGHWHQYLSGQRALVNGSLIGHGPFSDWIKAQHEVPRQAFCLIDSRRGPCMHTPIWVRPDSPRHVLDPVRSDEIRRRVLGTRENEAA